MSSARILTSKLQPSVRVSFWVLPSLIRHAFLFNGECKAYGSAQFSQLEILHRETGDVFTVAGGTSFRVAVTLEALVLYVQWVYVAVDNIIVTYQLYLSITYPLRVLYLGKFLQLFGLPLIGFIITASRAKLVFSL